MEMLIQGFQLMGIGLVGVFAALTLFFVVVKVLNAIFPAKEDKEND